MYYSFLNESVGRELIGASKFASKKSTAQRIMTQFPTPQALADQLQQNANRSFGKQKENLLNLSLKCRSLTPQQYPKFVNSITGSSSIWKMIGIGAATAAAYGATQYALNNLDQHIDNTPGGNGSNLTWKDGAQKIASNAMKDTRSAIQNIPGATKNWQTIKKYVPGADYINQHFKNSDQTAARLRQVTGQAFNYIPNKINSAYQNKVGAQTAAWQKAVQSQYYAPKNVQTPTWQNTNWSPFSQMVTSKFG